MQRNTLPTGKMIPCWVKEVRLTSTQRASDFKMQLTFGLCTNSSQWWIEDFKVRSSWA